MEISKLRDYFTLAKEYEHTESNVGKVIDNYCGFAELVFGKEHEIALGKEIGQAAKDYILRQLAERNHTFRTAEEYCQSHKTTNGFVDAYYEDRKSVV